MKTKHYRGKQKKRTWLKALLALILASMLVFFVLLGQVISGARDELNGSPRVMLILGCQVKPWGPSVLLQDRLDTALDYLTDHPDMTVIVSGGQGADEHISEARAMADYLMEHGVPEENILLEETSHNTMQNLLCSRLLLDQAGVDVKDGVLVVSNGFHLTRIRMLAGRFGYENLSTLSAPSSHVPSRLKMYVREPLALVKSFIFDR